MTFFAVRRWYGWGAGPILNLDIGGGSFEMALGQDELPELAMSVPLGASRLTRDWLHEDPPSAKSVKELRRYIRATLKPAVRKLRRAGQGQPRGGHLQDLPLPRPDRRGRPQRRRALRQARTAVPRPGALGAADLGHGDGGQAAPARASPRPARTSSSPVPWSRKRPWNCSSSSMVKICPWALREGLILRRLDQLVFEGPLEPAPHVGIQQASAAAADSSSGRGAFITGLKRRPATQKKLGGHLLQPTGAIRQSRRTGSITRTCEVTTTLAGQYGCSAGFA